MPWREGYERYAPRYRYHVRSETVWYLCNRVEVHLGPEGIVAHLEDVCEYPYEEYDEPRFMSRVELYATGEVAIEEIRPEPLEGEYPPR
jgi:hypothetical protein